MKNTNIVEQIKRQTKIVATIGPATHEVPMLTKMIDAGINVARLNMSHGDHKEHGERIKNIRKACEETSASLGILLDLAGPKIRTGEVKGESIKLVEGKKITLTTDDVVSTGEELTVKYKNLAKEVKVGGYVLLDDGRRKLLVEKINGNKVICKIIIGGDIKARRGVNMPGAHLSISAITEKDENDIKFAIKNKVDYIAPSFIRTADDVRKLKSLLPKTFKPLIISKIETEEALEKIDEILDESDGIMIARGDLAVEIPRERVPVIQKILNQKAKEKRKLVITATQMLETMINSPVPTRAEVSDIANAIFDGTDAVMLSEESAKGNYPIEAVTIMREVCETTDGSLDNFYGEYDDLTNKGNLRLQGALLAEYSDVKFIVTFTKSGATARKLSSFKGTKPIIALIDNKEVLDKSLLNRGVWPILIENNLKDLTTLKNEVRKILISKKIAKKGESIVIIVCGVKFGKEKEETNSIILETI